MTSTGSDSWSSERRARDEQIVAEPPLEPLELPSDVEPSPVEVHLRQRARQPLAVEGIVENGVEGIVENGVVRPLDPTVKLTEHSRVIIVAAEAN